VNGQDAKVMEFVRKHIKHVIYVVKENRTYDQVLGDLGNGANGDSSLTQFGESLTPNNHSLARQFVTLDNFMNPGDGSMDGWSWSMQGRVTNTEALTQQNQLCVSQVKRGLSYESKAPTATHPSTSRRWSSATRPQVVGDDELQRRNVRAAGQHGQFVAGTRQSCILRRALRHRGRLHLQRGAQERAVRFATTASW
jgi:hypothetical protein